MPTAKASPRQPKVEDQQLNFFLKRDKITSFAEFSPDKELLKKYKHVVVSRTADKCAFLFMEEHYREIALSVLVHNKSTLCSKLTLSAFKKGICVPLSKILHPNNGLASYSQFFEAVHCAMNYELSGTEENAVAYVAGWLEKKCEKDVIFAENEPLVTSSVKDFIEEVSRGALTNTHLD